MPPKRSSKRRAPSADAAPATRKRAHRTASGESSRQASVSWGLNDDESRHHYPLNTREASPAKGALRRNQAAEQEEDRDVSAEDFYDEQDEDDESDDAIVARHVREAQRSAQQEIAAKRTRSRGAKSSATDPFEEHVEEGLDNDDLGSVTPSNADSDDEKYAIGTGASSTTEVLPSVPRFGGGTTALGRAAANSRTATSTHGGVVGGPATAPKPGRKPSNVPMQSGGRKVEGGLPGLDFIESSTNKEGRLQKIFGSRHVDLENKDEVLAHNASILVRAVVAYARKYYRKNIDDGEAFFDALLEKENEHLIRYLGCLAIAGNKGEQSWVELLTKASTREALVVGVLGRALKEHVFAELWFGGREAQVKKMEKLEESEAFEDLDGFSRTEKRAEVVKTFVAKDEKANNEGLRATCREVTLKLDTMLAPFLHQKRPANVSERQQGLYDIVFFAGRLSRIMRQAPDVVYYWPPTFKDEEFEPSRMECLNLKDMVLSSPYEKQEINGLQRAVVREKHKGDNTEAIVQVVCFPGLVAYRQYGGETGTKEVAAENNRGGMQEPDDVRRVRQYRMRNGVEQIPDPNAHGFRSRVVCKSVVYLTWGKQRLLTREAGTSAHIDAVREGPAGMKKYEDDYSEYKELYDIAESRWGTSA